MSSEQRELIQNVAEDLEWLCSAWGEEVDDASLRRTSPVVRRLLIGEGRGDYLKAWCALGFASQPILYAIDLDNHLNAQGINPQGIAYAQAGGALYHGAVIASLLIANAPATRHDMEARSKTPPQMREFKLGQYLQSVSVIVGTLPNEEDTVPLVRVTREQVVKYIANKKGGAHFDTSRDNKTQAAFTSLDKAVAARIVLIDKPAVYYELLSIGQVLARSPSTTKFLDEAKRQLGA